MVHDSTGKQQSNKIDVAILEILLTDRTTKKNILWMTNNYSSLGEEFKETSEILISHIVGGNSNIIKPRNTKSKREQTHRIRDKGEVFTPSWICNKQNNFIDQEWFGYPNVFNKEHKKKWITDTNKIIFPEKIKKSWKDYVCAPRMEITCGEAPYLISRYDTTSGKKIPVIERVGLLDRKLRIVSENTSGDKELWTKWARKAIQSIYGYEWQGDNLLLARKNILLTFVDYFTETFKGEKIQSNLLEEIAYIISWNLWQMDGIKYVVPMSCHETVVIERELFEDKVFNIQCEGCSSDNILKHNGEYCLINDWEKDDIITAVSLLKG